MVARHPSETIEKLCGASLGQIYRWKFNRLLYFLQAIALELQYVKNA